MPRACSVATSVQACFGSTATPVCGQERAQRRRPVRFGDGRRALVDDPQLALAGRPAPRARGARPRRRGAGAKRTFRPSTSSSGTTLRARPPWARRDRQGVVEDQAVDLDRVAPDARPPAAGTARPSGSRSRPPTAARCGRCARGTTTSALMLPTQPGVHRARGRLADERERRVAEQRARRRAPRGGRSGGSGPPRGRRTRRPAARSRAAACSSTARIAASPPFMSAAPRPTTRRPSRCGRWSGHGGTVSRWPTSATAVGSAGPLRTTTALPRRSTSVFGSARQRASTSSASAASSPVTLGIATSSSVSAASRSGSSAVTPARRSRAARR